MNKIIFEIVAILNPSAKKSKLITAVPSIKEVVPNWPPRIPVIERMDSTIATQATSAIVFKGVIEFFLPSRIFTHKNNGIITMASIIP